MKVFLSFKSKRVASWHSLTRLDVCSSQHQIVSETMKSSYVWRFTTTDLTERLYLPQLLASQFPPTLFLLRVLS